MRLQHKEALSILGCANSATIEDIKIAYRRACSMFHPDRNPAGLEMMKLINAAYESLKDYVSVNGSDDDVDLEDNLGDEINMALNAIIGLGLTIEICGSWIWVSGDTKPHRELLKEAGYRFAPKKLMWSFCGGKRTSSRGKYSMDDIRVRHGSVYVKRPEKKYIAA